MSSHAHENQNVLINSKEIGTIIMSNFNENLSKFECSIYLCSYDSYDVCVERWKMEVINCVILFYKEGKSGKNFEIKESSRVQLPQCVEKYKLRELEKIVRWFSY